MEKIKLKVFLGYLSLIVIVGLSGWVIYTEFIRYNQNENEINPINNKILVVNNILTNLYQAEGLDRSFAENGKSKFYNDYQFLIDTIHMQIDSLSKLMTDTDQKKHSDSLKSLLHIKQNNLNELIAIKNNNSTQALYERAVKKIETEKDTINHYLELYKNVGASLDSINHEEEKEPFFNRLFDLFRNKNENDSTLEAGINRIIRKDSLINKINPADSIAKILMSVIHDIRAESIRQERQLKSKEREIIENNRIITLQLREILSTIEKEELLNSFQKVQEQRIHIRQATFIMIILGALALFTIVFFSVNILRDITKSQHYRINLEKSKAFAESLLKSKEKFMLSLTHDLKSPLNSIIGFTRLLQKNADTEDQKKFLQRIDKSSKHILKLVTDLLDLARLQNGKLKIDKSTFQWKGLITDTVDNFKAEADAKGIYIHLDNKIPENRHYSSDPLRITQILVNLISNAIKFTSQGGIKIITEIASSDGKTDKVKIMVEDTGQGISKEDQETIFEEFTQAQNQDKAIEGTGLGLTITKKLVHLLGGGIKLDSIPGQGSKFEILLPLIKSSVTKQEQKKEEIYTGNASLKALEGIKILIVDDDSTLLEMMTAVLKSHKAQVTGFSNPEKALENFRKNSADILITDLQMPEMEGFELLKKLEEKNEKKIPSIIISGKYNLDAAAQKYFNGFLRKPFEPGELLEMILKVIYKTKFDNSFTAINSGKVSEHTAHGYTMERIRAFSADDEEGFRNILDSLLKNAQINKQEFKKHLKEENINQLSELAHKMLNLYRQLEAREIYRYLEDIEMAGKNGVDKNKIFTNAELALEEMDVLLIRIREDYKEYLV